MSNKTISINPSLFSIGSSKTKKNREKKSKPTAVPLISPNVLKNKLLKRIKEHKQKETNHLENNKRRLTNNIEVKVPNSETNIEMLNYTDEFTDSINYLQTLSKQKKIDSEKRKHEELMQKRKEELERKTIRNHHSLGGYTPSIQIDLPEDLMPSPPVMSEPIKINYPLDDVPYGVLKGGSKPSYREWAKTQRNNVVTNPSASLIIPEGMNSQQTARENRLQLLKQKIKNKNDETKIEMEPAIKKPMPETIQQNVLNAIPQPSILNTNTNVNSTVNSTVNDNSTTQTGGTIVATKHITKKTIKRKYTLGKSKLKKTVSILIKDRGTRKKILTAQKELKRKNINDIKAYLREHNLIKTGSSAPNDVLRKMYESAMLTGEITNKNAEILLHNLSKEEKQL